MAAITAAVVGGASLLGSAYSANRQSSAAKDASRAQSRGVEAARLDTLEARDRAMAAFNGQPYQQYQQQPVYQYGMANQSPMQLAANGPSQTFDPASTLGPRPTPIPNPKRDRGIDFRNQSALADWNKRAQGLDAQQGSSSIFGSRPSGGGLSGMIGRAGFDVKAAAQQQDPSFQSQGIQQQGMPPQGFPQQGFQQPGMPQQMPQGFGDPNQNYLSGVQSGLQFTNQGYGQAIDTMNPIASLAQPYIDEQYNLLGMGGQDQYQQALGRVADPMRAEQERAFMRNNAQLGGVGGNALSALAEQTRSRTEANIGNRLGMLSAAGTPSLNALQSISNMRLNQGLRMGDILQGAGSDLSTMEQNRRSAMANIELGQGNQLAQLSQNLGNARAGGSAYAAQNAPALAQGLTSGLSAFMGAGGGQQASNWLSQLNTNRQSGYGNIGDPFA